MKKYILLLFFMNTSTIILSQESSDKYAALIKKGDTFYWTKNYKKSALTYSEAFKLKKGKVPMNDRYKALTSWALIGIPDSAFFQLNYIVANGNFINYHQITADRNLKLLQKDKRWKPILEIVKKNNAEQEPVTQVYKIIPIDKLLKQASNDFATAEEIHDSIIEHFNISRGFGSQLDFKSENCEETNSAWFKLRVDKNSFLTFDIVGIEPYDDFDFIVFKCPNPSYIDSISSNKVKPDRGSFANNCGYSVWNSTGLSEYSTELWSGHNKLNCANSYVSGLQVKAGEIIYLMVTLRIAAETSKGFTIYLHYNSNHKPKAVKAGIVLENALFETEKAVLLKESYVSLDKLLNQLQTNKTMRIEISGHTDNIGDETENQKLSEERAKTIVLYLISKKIEKDRLSFKGFGSKQPIASNDTEEGRKKNRRVEFVVLTK